MPMSTLIKTRVKHKHDTAANWEKSEAIPLLGELIVYDQDEVFSSPRIKIGDGVTLAKDLAFVEDLPIPDEEIITLVESIFKEEADGL